MTSWQLKKLNSEADMLVFVLREVELVTTYTEFSDMKKLLRGIIDPDLCAVLRLRGIEL